MAKHVKIDSILWGAIEISANGHVRVSLCDAFNTTDEGVTKMEFIKVTEYPWDGKSPREDEADICGVDSLTFEEFWIEALNFKNATWLFNTKPIRIFLVGGGSSFFFVNQ